MAVGVTDPRGVIPFPPDADLQFAWRSGPPPMNYGWVRTGAKGGMITTDASNDCTALWSTNQSLCFQKPVPF